MSQILCRLSWYAVQVSASEVNSTLCSTWPEVAKSTQSARQAHTSTIILVRISASLDVSTSRIACVLLICQRKRTSAIGTWHSNISCKSVNRSTPLPYRAVWSRKASPLSQATKSTLNNTRTSGIKPPLWHGVPCSVPAWRGAGVYGSCGAWGVSMRKNGRVRSRAYRSHWSVMLAMISVWYASAGNFVDVPFMLTCVPKKSTVWKPYQSVHPAGIYVAHLPLLPWYPFMYLPTNAVWYPTFCSHTLTENPSQIPPPPRKASQAQY